MINIYVFSGMAEFSFFLSGVYDYSFFVIYIYLIQNMFGFLS